MKLKIILLGLTVVFIGHMCTSSAFAQRGGRGGASQESVWEYYAEKYDKDSDGKLSKTEYDRGDERFARLDKNKDGVLTKEDWTEQSGGRRRGGRRGGARAEAPVVGDVAPDFELVDINDPTKKVSLSSFKGEKAVALIFGSCT